MDDGVHAFMRAMGERFPAVETMTAQEVRAVLVDHRIPVTNTDDVASAVDSRVPGDFALCDLESHDGFCRAMSRHTESVVVSVDYRLAPGHRAPAAVDDAFAVFCWVVAQTTELGIDPARVVRMPAGQVLIYPVIDPTFGTESAAST